MKEQLAKIEREALEAITGAGDPAALDELRVKYLGKKGELTAVLKQMGKLSAEERPAMGALANEVRSVLEETIELTARKLAAAALEARFPALEAVMIGRGALGDPWILSRTNALLTDGVLPDRPAFPERLETAVRQIELAAADKGEHIALLEARRHVNWYLKGEPGLKPYKARISQLSFLSELHALAAELKNHYTHV